MASNNNYQDDKISDVDLLKNYLDNGWCVFKFQMTESENLHYWISKDIDKPKDCEYLPMWLFDYLPYYWNNIIIKRITPDSDWCKLYACVNVMYDKNEPVFCNKPINNLSYRLLQWQLNISTGVLEVDPANAYTVRYDNAVNRLKCWHDVNILNRDFTLSRVSDKSDFESDCRI